MADITWGVKMSEEQKERLNELIEQSGLTAKEFMVEIMQIYELQKVKESVPEVTQDIGELQKLLQRIGSIYINIGERIHTLIRSKEAAYEKLLTEKDDVLAEQRENTCQLTEAIEQLEAQTNELQEQKNILTEECETIKKEMAEKEARLKEIIASNKALLAEYQEKNTALTETIKNMREDLEKVNSIKDKAENLRSHLADEKFNVRTLEAEIEKKDRDIDALKAEIEVIKEQHLQEIQRLHIENENNTHNLLERLELEKDKELLEAQKRFQVELHQLTEEYHAKTSALLKKLEERQDLQQES